MQMFVRILLLAGGNRILGRFQLHNHPSETLRERVVDVSRHSISFGEDCALLALFGKLIELNSEHRLVSKRLRQSDLLRPIRRPIAMANTDDSFDLPAYQRR